jgi:hypothetical protein
MFETWESGLDSGDLKFEIRAVGWAACRLDPHPLKTESAAPKCRFGCTYLVIWV